MRINLTCPYEDKDEAKSLGARWDAAKKVWYIINPTSLAPFARWLSTDVQLFYKPKKKKKKVSKKKEVEPHVKKFQKLVEDMHSHMKSIT